MQPMHLHSAFSETATSAGAMNTHATPVRRHAWGQVGKGIIAFVAGITIGASTIIIAELMTPQADPAASFEQGPLDLRR